MDGKKQHTQSVAMVLAIWHCQFYTDGWSRTQSKRKVMPVRVWRNGMVVEPSQGAALSQCPGGTIHVAQGLCLACFIAIINCNLYIKIRKTVRPIHL
uniref:Uncharacterized protein n=1 Tax=Catharus ustulatus TaxID=91951 RepID=A0A8C3U3E8_CATUS